MRRLVVVGVGMVLLAGFGLSACQKKPAQPPSPGENKPVVSEGKPAAPATLASLPHRKEGLWSQTMQTRGMTQTTRICIGPDTEKRMTAWGQAVGKTPCGKTQVTPTAGGWAFDNECDMGQGGLVKAHGEASGDFSSAYTMKITSVTTGSAMPQANGTHEMLLKATYEGACPAGMKPGDLTMNVPGMRGGMKMNLEQMAAMRR